MNAEPCIVGWFASLSYDLITARLFRRYPAELCLTSLVAQVDRASSANRARSVPVPFCVVASDGSGSAEAFVLAVKNLPVATWRDVDVVVSQPFRYVVRSPI